MMMMKKREEKEEKKEAKEEKKQNKKRGRKRQKTTPALDCLPRPPAAHRRATSPDEKRGFGAFINFRFDSFIARILLHGHSER